jgi:hypothetical protein
LTFLGIGATVAQFPVPWRVMSDATLTHPDLSLGVVHDYASLHDALRRRADQLQLSRATLDNLTGLADGHSSKLLALSHPKILGEKSFGLLLAALGLRLVVEEDPQALAKYAARCKPRAEWQVRDGMRTIARIRRREWLFTPKRAKEVAALRMAKLSPEQRQRLARRAARARWPKAREQTEG